MALTPMMNQYFQIKDSYKDCIVFFRLGDFYEMFYEDAELASKELELVLTGRDCGLEKKAPMCGIPYHAASTYVGRLINKGYKVAICEQMEDPQFAKGIVKRDIVKIYTPGTYNEGVFLEENKNNYIMSLYSENNQCGICFADISTGELLGTNIYVDTVSILDEISKFNPSEIVIEDNFSKSGIIASINERFNIHFTIRPKEFYNKNIGSNFSKFDNFNTDSYEKAFLASCNGLLNYIEETQRIVLTNIFKIDYYNITDYLTIDINSRRNLELTETIRDKSKKGSLLWVIDKTVTSMGGRELRRWIEQPLIHKESINKRLDAIEELLNNVNCMEDLKEDLKEVYDIERICGKISSKSVNAKELIALKSSISKLPNIKEHLFTLNSSLFKDIKDNFDTLKDLYDILENSIMDSPLLSIKDGNIIKEGYNGEIDELRQAKAHGKEWIANMENSEREFTGIKSLKVGYNRVFGYYIEITNANSGNIPEGRYTRKQTLSNAERFITKELKEIEDKILGAEDRLSIIEYDIFTQIRDTVEGQIIRIKEAATVLAKIDSMLSLATVARENNYCKPVFFDDGVIKIKDGRHPVVEKVLKSGSFVANDIYINMEDEKFLLITGPNMAGKSTFMRQVALIILMAQMGSFVPASKAELSVCDKIFTRIGASDDLAAGKSTFMVEMWEVSNILKNATNKSLILLDEVGRGTSTYDGLSIAWSVIEYICSSNSLSCKTLFATHYHELVRLEGVIKGVKNYSVAVKRIGGEIAFLRKIVEGGADESYGIEVAKLAGLPSELIVRAKEILLSLENKDNKLIKNKLKEEVKSKDEKQLDISDLERENFIKDISKLDILNMTPIGSMNKMNELIKGAKSIT